MKTITKFVGAAFVVLTLAMAATTANAALGNYSDTSQSLSTNTTVTPDAVPTDTTSISASVSTDFKGKLEGDPTTGVVRVTDAHPAGSYTVTVTAFNGGSVTAIKTFTLTVTTPVTCIPISFAAATNFGAGNNPASVGVGDFNGDGKQDLAVANWSIAGTVSILLGDGVGNFSGPLDFGAGDQPISIVVGDFNSDGKQDLAVANQGSNDVSILLGDGAGNFSGPFNFGAGSAPTGSMAVGDFNGDGKQDLAVANQGSHDVSILLGDGAGSFSGPFNFGADSGPLSVAVGDFNGDGNQDLAVANGFSGTVSILLGDGTGNFSAPTNFGTDSNSQSVAVGNFNGDGNQDLVVTNYAAQTVSILLGDGTGNFGTAANFPVVTGPYPVAVGDFNGDGQQDIAVGYGTSTAVSIFLGDGTGNFGVPTDFGTGCYPASVAVGDFNGDGKQDVAAAGYISGALSIVSVLLRDCALTPVPPSITTQPAAKTVNVGETARFRATATGTSPLHYQWRKNGANIPGATRPSYTTPATVEADNGSLFSVVVSNTVGSVTSNDATLTIRIPPTISTQPADTTVRAGRRARFSVVATGTAPLHYQWTKNGVNIPGATKASYTTPPTTAGDNGALFAVTVSNLAGNVTSNNAILTVR